MNSVKKSLLTQALSCALGAIALLHGPIAWTQTDIHNEPLAQPASNVKPNVLLLHDDSGSMRQQYTPDYIGRYFGGSNALCYDSADGGSIGTSLENCEAGDPPMMSPEFNTQYYNPEIRYFAGLNADGSSKDRMDCANTGGTVTATYPFCVNGWTNVPTDAISTSGADVFRKSTLDMNGGHSQVNFVNLATGYPDRAWCDSPSRDHTSSSNFPTACRLNSAYTYPNLNFGFGRSGDGSVKYVFGAPYYYRIAANEHCTNATLTNCVASSVPTATHPVPAPVRYCDSTSLSNCQAKYQGSFTRPKFTGLVVGSGGSNPPSKATGTITVDSPQSDNFSGSITSIKVGGTELISVAANAAGPIDAGVAAATIRDRINANSTSGLNHGYTATVSANIVTVSAPTTGSLSNGLVITVTSPGTSNTLAEATIRTNNVDDGNSVSSIVVGSGGAAVQLLSGTLSCDTGTTCTGNQGRRDAFMAAQVASMINANATSGLMHGFTASVSGEFVSITAPVNTGSEYNGRAVTVTSSGLSAQTAGLVMAGGVTEGDIETETVNFSGGFDANEGRAQTGNFLRTSIVPFQDAANTVPSLFPKSSNRSDCAAASTCTYAEEMTNFANWYAYYRSRGQMAKTAIGRAFSTLTNQFRVGFMTINPSNPVSSDRFLAINDFEAGTGAQKENWYAKLYGTIDNGSTPLRVALSRAGHYLSGTTNTFDFGGAASPIQVACQPNFTIMVTDGYWNQGNGYKLDGSAMDNQDNVNAGYSTQAVGAWDGNILRNTIAGTDPGGSGTLADVAMYYYKTDLRTDLTNLVPATQKDAAPHQHMTTFTVGMGLAGRLNYDKNYEEQTTGDFLDIKQGVRAWPSPEADAETALDDLWHAAVNGRGRFFSAKDPQELSSSILDTLNSVQARVGAGAAAATSNLQPVAGDNFAFTAQFQTVDWIGDLKARTIDLSTGVVATRELWSAGASLSARSALSRKIFTFDAEDHATGALPGNLNRLKAFCWPGASLVLDGNGNPLYTGCQNEAELDQTTEVDAWFDPQTLSQASQWNSDVPQPGRNGTATKQNLIDYLRGDTVNETSGGTLPTDLYRSRAGGLGDIVNAQPAYVKTPPFGYNTGTFAGADPFYGEYKAANATRRGTVFAAANDGMLHAFETDPDNNPYFQTAGITTSIATDDTFTGTLSTSATDGEGAERWAYIPRMVMPNLKFLAETSYAHRYYVDGSPVVGDICFGHTISTPCAAQSNWHTIVVGGLNAGGRGYYALDITDPLNPKALWEFRGGSAATCHLTDDDAAGSTEDCNVGLSFGNPIITKRPSDGKWVVLVTSGYNNVSPGDGIGRLYVLDAQTGVILKRFSTPVGDTTTPSGLSRIQAWVDNAFFNNTALTVYGGDLLGNLWRFELSGATNAAVPANSITRIATLVDPSGVPQPISTRPELAEVNGNRAIYVATGKFLGTTDKTNLQRQSIYAIKDTMNSVVSPTVPMTRSGSFPTSTITGFVRQDMVGVTGVADQRTTTTVATSEPFVAPTDLGWFVDLPDGGTTGNPSERVNVDPVLQLGTLVVASNVPSADTCVAGGYGWLNFLDYKTGSYIPGTDNNVASTKVSASLIVGVNVVQLPGGTVKTIVTTADNQQLTKDTPVAPTSIEGRRVSWRELFIE